MKLRLNVDGKTYEVEVEIIEEDQPQRGPAPSGVQSASAGSVAASTPAAIPPAAASGGPTDESKALRSPISGVVVRVPVQVGQAVKTNDVLMVLEAMKMETVITSQCDGKISKINARAGDAVQVKQVLVEFE